jgi:hypothetical protein
MTAQAIVATIPIATKMPAKIGHLGGVSGGSGFTAQTAG